MFSIKNQFFTATSFSINLSGHQLRWKGAFKAILTRYMHNYAQLVVKEFPLISGLASGGVNESWLSWLVCNCDQAGGKMIFRFFFYLFPVSANYLTKIGPTGLLAHECHCWANHSTTTAEHVATPDTGDCKAESTTSWNVLAVSQPFYIMFWCKYCRKNWSSS